jgi:hypothetical protein
MSSVPVIARRREIGILRIALFAVILVALLWAALWGAILVSDNGRVPAELAAAAQQPGEMVCSAGTIARGDGSFIDTVFGTGRFRCIGWRMRNPRVDPATGATEWPTSPRR